jgi:hypothetical protein
MVDETLDRHLYTNDNSKKLEEAKTEVIESEALEPEEVIDYIIQKYQFKF